MRLRWRRQSIWTVREGDLIRYGGLFRWQFKGQVIDGRRNLETHTVDGHVVTPSGRTVEFSVGGGPLHRCHRLVVARRDEVVSLCADDDLGHFVGIGPRTRPTGWLTLARSIVAEQPEEPFPSLEAAALAVLWAKSQGHQSFVESSRQPAAPPVEGG